MARISAGVELAQRKRRVLLGDFDLEALRRETRKIY